MALKQLLTNLGNFGYYSGGRGYVSTPNNFGQKSIPYGYDRPGGGSSGQPFVTVSRQNSFELNTEQLGGVGLDNDLFIRGGVSVAKHIKDDEIRIGKFLTSSNGLLWIAQQNLLEKTFKPKLPNSIYPREIYNPVNTLVQLAGNPIGLHVNKSGLNPLYFDLPYGQGQNSYLVQTRDNYNSNGTNRLAILYQSKIGLLGETAVNKKVAKDFSIKFDDNEFIINDSTSNYRRVTNTTITKQTFNNIDESQYSTFDSNQVAGYGPYKSDNISSLSDFRDYVYDGGPEVGGGFRFKSFLAKGNYQENNRQSIFGMSDPGTRFKDVSDITALSSNSTTDKISTSTLYSSPVNTDLSESDLIPFYFQAVDNDNPSNSTFIHFRAYIDNFGDNFTGNWQSFKYSGRGENFYIYDNFQRSVSLGFTIAIESRLEQQPQYEKINYLASLTAPDYSKDTGFMRGNFVKLTVGDYLVQVPGFINSINYTVENNVPWDIARGENGTLLNNGTQILPMVIRASMTFTPVHNFVPKTDSDFIGNRNKRDRYNFVNRPQNIKDQATNTLTGKTIVKPILPKLTSPGQISIKGNEVPQGTPSSPVGVFNNQRRVAGPINNVVEQQRSINQRVFKDAIPDGLPNA